MAFVLCLGMLCGLANVAHAHTCRGALECGGRYTKCVQALTRLMGHHGRGKKPCPYCDSCEVPLLEYVISAHNRLLRISEHSTSESILHSICKDIFSDIAHFCLLF